MRVFGADWPSDAPVPESAAVCGLAPSPPEYATLKVVDRDPAADGENVTVKVQLMPAAIDPPAAPQDPAPEFAMVKSPAFPPVVLGVMPVAAIELLFVSVKVPGALGLPTLIEPKFSAEGERTTLVLPSSGCGYV